MRFALAITCSPAKIQWFLAPAMTMGILIRPSGMALLKRPSSWHDRLCPASQCTAPEGGQVFAWLHGIACPCWGQIQRGTLGSAWPMDHEAPRPDHSWGHTWRIAWRVCRGCCRRFLPTDFEWDDSIDSSLLNFSKVSGQFAVTHKECFMILLPSSTVLVVYL